MHRVRAWTVFQSISEHAHHSLTHIRSQFRLSN
uniref:Uncharacterized protein n=1 Tax=Anguilla anguilla TaxID=7936 RepID=A0A0E9SAF7_ANGAN